MKQLDIARVCHQVNKSYCESICDMSQVDWDDTSDAVKASAVDGVQYHIDFESTPEQSHDNWKKFKLNDGWVYGVNKSEVLKTHPCIVEYTELPVEQRTKDYIFSSIVKELKDANL